jgi:transposase
LEILRARTRHDEAQALRNAERKSDEHWQGVVAEQAAKIAELQEQLKGIKPQVKSGRRG